MMILRLDRIFIVAAFVRTAFFLFQSSKLQSNFLCAFKLGGNSSTVQFQFAECVNDQLGFKTDPGHFPHLDVKGALDTCATATNLDTQALWACAREEGPHMLDESFAEGDRRGIGAAPAAVDDMR